MWCLYPPVRTIKCGIASRFSTRPRKVCRLLGAEIANEEPPGEFTTCPDILGDRSHELGGVTEERLGRVDADWQLRGSHGFIADCDRSGLKSAREGFDEGQDLAEEFIPAGDLAEAGFFEVGGGRGRVDAGLEDAQAVRAVFEMGIDAVAEVAAGEFAQAGLGGEVFFADAGQIDLVHGAEGAEPTQTFTRGSATELQATLHIVERKRFRSAEEEAVNFADGAGQREGSEDMNKKGDGL